MIFAYTAAEQTHLANLLRWIAHDRSKGITPERRAMFAEKQRREAAMIIQQHPDDTHMSGIASIKNDAYANRPETGRKVKRWLELLLRRT